MVALSVEVFPIAHDRWIAVIEADAGPFSTETAEPEQVRDEVRRSIHHVLGRDLPFALVDDQGRPWLPEVAAEQLARILAQPDV